MKKVISFALMLILTFSLCPCQIFAEADSAAFELLGAEGNDGDVVDVGVALKNNPGITALKIQVTYSKENLELVSCQDQGLFGNAISMSDNVMQDPYIISWYAFDSMDTNVSGTFALLKFRILQGAKTSDITIDYDEEDVFNINYENQKFDVVNAQIKVAAQKYTVSFHTNDGSAIAPQTVESGTNATKPADPTKNGYTFGGWYKEADLKNVYDFAQGVTGDVTLYAKWIADTGSSSGSNSSGSEAQTAVSTDTSSKTEAKQDTVSETEDSKGQEGSSVKESNVLDIGTQVSAESGDTKAQVTILSGTTVALDGMKDVSGKATIPGKVTVNGHTYTVTSIGKEAFAGNLKITSIFLPKQIKMIDTKVFDRCMNLKTANVGNGTTIVGTAAFANCEKLKTILLGKAVQTIKAKAFAKDQSLRKIYVKGTSLREVDAKVFLGIKKANKNKIVVIIENPEKFTAYQKLFVKAGLKKRQIKKA